MIQKFLKSILDENIPTPSIIGWIVGFAGIVLVRIFLELFSDPLPSGLIASKPQSLIAVFFFYLSIAIGLSVIISFFTKQRGGQAMSLLLYGLPVIWVAPIVDIIASGGRGFTMSYIFDSHGTLISDFFMFFGPILNDGRGLTTGIHLELLIIMFTIGWYVWNKQKNVLTTLGALFSSYVLIFTMLSLPGFLYTLVSSDYTAASALAFFAESIKNSNIPANTLHGSLSYRTTQSLLDFGFDVLVSQILLVISFIFGILWAWYTNKETLKKILGNARPERILFYVSLLSLGMYLAHIVGHVAFTWVDWVGITTIIISWFAAWMFSVHTNDIADIKIDTISNPERPLPKKMLSVETMRDVGFLWLVLSLVGSYIAGYYIFYMNIMFLTVYYIYSAPPLRLKRVPVLSSFLISLACVATILAGFFFVSPNKLPNAFPVIYSLGLILVFTLGVNIRDIKDVEGDRASNIYTLPVLFGAYGIRVVGTLFALAFLLAPFFLPFFFSLTLSVPAAIIGYWLCTRKQYKEKYVFLLFFVYALLSILSSVALL